MNKISIYVMNGKQCQGAG